MTRIHKLFSTIAAIMLLLVISCSFDSETTTPSGHPDFPEYKEEAGLKISCTAKKLNRARGLNGDNKTPVIPDELLVVPELKSENLITTVTPKYYIMDIGYMVLYNPININDFESGAESQELIYMDQHDGFNMVNWLVDKGMPAMELNGKTLQAKPWTGFGIHYLSYLCSSNIREGYDGYYGGSFVGLELPEGITVDKLDNKVINERLKQGNIELDPDLVWFDFKSLMPHKTGHNPSELIFQQGITEMQILNPDGKSGDFTHGCFLSHGNPTCIALPMSSTLDFSNIKNPEIEIEYDTEDLIQFYQVAGKDTPNDTSDDRYRAVFNVLDPYPIEIEIDEYDNNDIYWYSDNQLDKDISDTTLLAGLKVRRFNNHIDLNWIKPNYGDISHIVITHNTVDNEKTAEVIYQGNANNFVHNVDDVLAPHHYWGYVVNEDGEVSKGFKFLPAPENKNPDPKPDTEAVTKDMFVITELDMTNSYPYSGRWYDKNNIDPELKNTKYVQSLTPTHVYLDFDNVDSYNAKDKTEPSKGFVDGTGFGFPEFWKEHAPVDMMANRNELNAGLSYIEQVNYDSFYFHISSYLDQSTGQGSFVGIKLPAEIKPEDVDNCITSSILPKEIDQTGTDIWIKLKDLVPTKGKFIDHWCFQSATGYGMLNQEGKTEEQSFGLGGGYTDRSGLVYPFAEALDFKKHDGVVLTFYPKDMLQLVSYDSNGTTRYKVLLKDNLPFPIHAKPYSR